MASSLQYASVYTLTGKKDHIVPLPSIFRSPIRPDIVRTVHTNMIKNKRQAYAVKKDAGYQTSASSWGTGRAVSRIPRVSGGGTHRAGQGAFGNMCRGGGMASPTQLYRHWFRKINRKEKRLAIASCLSASMIPSIVLSRGHEIEKLPECPCIIHDSIEALTKTKEAISFLEQIGLKNEILKSKNTSRIRRGQGKQRNRRYTTRLGPLVIYNQDKGISKAFRNIEGIECCSVDRLNLLRLAPGGHVGRLCIWSKGSIEKIKLLYQQKKNFSYPLALMKNTDIARIINSSNVQGMLTVQKNKLGLPLYQQGSRLYRNPFKHRKVLRIYNPAHPMLKIWNRKLQQRFANKDGKNKESKDIVQ